MWKQTQKCKYATLENSSMIPPSLGQRAEETDLFILLGPIYGHNDRNTVSTLWCQQSVKSTI